LFFVYMCAYCIFVLFVCSLCSFSTLILLVGSFDLLNRRPDNLYCVGETLNPAQSINQQCTEILLQTNRPDAIRGSFVTILHDFWFFLLHFRPQSPYSQFSAATKIFLSIFAHVVYESPINQSNTLNEMALALTPVVISIGTFLKMQINHE